MTQRVWKPKAVIFVITRFFAQIAKDGNGSVPGCFRSVVHAQWGEMLPTKEIWAALPYPAALQAESRAHDQLMVTPKPRLMNLMSGYVTTMNVHDWNRCLIVASKGEMSPFEATNNRSKSLAVGQPWVEFKYEKNTRGWVRLGQQWEPTVSTKKIRERW